MCAGNGKELLCLGLLLQLTGAGGGCNPVDMQRLPFLLHAGGVEMEQRAAEMGADAVVGVDIDYEVLGADNGMLMVTVSGTAVRIEY